MFEILLDHSDHIRYYQPGTYLRTEAILRTQTWRFRKLMVRIQYVLQCRVRQNAPRLTEPKTRLPKLKTRYAHNPLTTAVE
jgi:hypothetical protein